MKKLICKRSLSPIIKRAGFCLLLAIVVFVSCNDSDNKEEGIENQVFNGYAKNLESRPGHNRVQLSFEIANDQVDYFVVSWDHGSSSDTISKGEAQSGIIETIIDGLSEGSHTFKILAYDEKNNPAVASVLIQVKVYGEQYIASLQNRAVKDLTFIYGKDPVMDWSAARNGEIALDIYYTNETGNPDTLRIPETQQSVTIPGYVQNTTIKYRSLYLPVKTCIDTFYSPVVTLPPLTYTDEYMNPVFEPVLADPSVVRGDDKYFYAFGTEDTWGGVVHRVAIVRSKDLVNWTHMKDAFSSTNRPEWKSGGIWAPDVVKINGIYYLYYALSTWGDANPGIGLATSKSMDTDFSDQGELFDSQDINVPNSIDPFYFEDGNKKYLFWGSYSTSENQGTYGVELTDDGKSILDIEAKFKIAAGDFEAVTIHKRGNYYYFIGSKGGCCDGANSSYNLRVARSEKLEGPYLDKNGKNVVMRGAGSLLLQGNDIYAGTGHCSRIITDDNNTDWLLYHAILKNNPYEGSTNRRVLMLDKVEWDEDGWPVINNNTPTTIKHEGPYFK